ncbi:hypothetical protein EYF80_010285 [Liparis tanakae]|uniref:Uncharacterized protein n=1 Tax=Liparis tanakae TaxID=230148 RepID=A0A4Z2INS5_9TELE|nr:hypothetical protein EYF80_010285 [Liparis tanakae]
MKTKRRREYNERRDSRSVLDDGLAETLCGWIPLSLHIQQTDRQDMSCPGKQCLPGCILLKEKKKCTALSKDWVAIAQ